MKDETLDAKQQAILQAAWAAFAAYGFRKTSMDDIATGAGMSRPALYLHYRNKNDILRSLVQSYYDTAVVDVAQALKGPGTVAMCLHHALLAQGGPKIEAMLNSPHGMELLESSSTTAADVVDKGEAQLRNIYADWFAVLASNKQIDLPKTPIHLAETLTYACKGLKKSGVSAEDYKMRLETLAMLCLLYTSDAADE